MPRAQHDLRREHRNQRDGEVAKTKHHACDAVLDERPDVSEGPRPANPSATARRHRQADVPGALHELAARERECTQLRDVGDERDDVAFVALCEAKAIVCRRRDGN